MVIIWSNTASSACSIHFKVIRDFLQHTQKWPKHTQPSTHKHTAIRALRSFCFCFGSSSSGKIASNSHSNCIRFSVVALLLFCILFELLLLLLLRCCVPGSGSASYFCISFAACAIIIKYANRTKTFSARMVWDRHRTTVMYIDLGDRVMKLCTLENADQVDSLSVPSKDPQRATNCISK